MAELMGRRRPLCGPFARIDRDVDDDDDGAS